MKKNYKILLIDDDKFLLEMYALKIREAGAEVVTLLDIGVDFVDKVVEIKPDLIAMDVIMPNINGFQAIKMLKADENTRDIPVFFATNLGQPKDIKKGLALGAVDYIILASLPPAEVASSYFSYLDDPTNYNKKYLVLLKTKINMKKEKILSWLKENWFKLILVMLAFLFLYFTQVEPRLMDRKCLLKSKYEYKGSVHYNQSDYKECLYNKGLEF